MRARLYQFWLLLTVGGTMPLFGLPAKKINTLSISSEVQEEKTNYPLNVTGTIPLWLSGLLIRNGPIRVTIPGETPLHWLDGLAMLHSFVFQRGKIIYTNKFLRSDAYRTVFEEGSLHYIGFASKRDQSLFRRSFEVLKSLFALFNGAFFQSKSHPPMHNANVNIAKLADHYVALTEIPLPIVFDPRTLDTKGVFNYQDQLPKEKCWESAHPHYDSLQKETLNYLIQFGRTSYYILYRLKDSSAEREIIAKIPVQEPAYMHSFAVTEHHVVFTEFPFVVKPLELIMRGKAFIKNFTWQPQRGTRFIVVNRHSGAVVGTYKTRPFFAFHHANAFEKDGIISIDSITYEDAGVVAVENLSTNPGSYSSQLERFSLSLETGIITSDIITAQSVEFPRINERLDGKPYHYIYATAIATGTVYKEVSSNTTGLYKINTETKEVLEWSENGCSAGEPVFVATPTATQEDEGIIFALISDHLHSNSFLLLLDGKSFQEVGRAQIPHMIPLGLHGQYYNDEKLGG